MFRRDFSIRKLDIADRHRDVAYNKISWERHQLMAHRERLTLSLEFLHFMEHQFELLKQQVELLEMAARMPPSS